MSFAGQHNLMPGIGTEFETDEAELYWGLIGQAVRQAQPLDSTITDAGNTPTDVLRPGLVVAKKTSDAMLHIWDPDAKLDGTEIPYGFLAGHVKMNYNGTATDRFFGPVCVAGPVKADRILIPGESTYGINGHAYELLLRAHLTNTGRFLLDDELQGNPFGSWQRIVNLTHTEAADYTVLEAHNNTLFLVTGAGDAEFTLPTARAGFHYGFVHLTNQELLVTATPADSLITANNAAADGVSYTTTGEQIGGLIEVLGISTAKWLHMNAIASNHAMAVGTTIISA